MTAEIRVYVEGSGRDKAGVVSLRTAFNSFLRGPREKARRKRINLRPLPRGSRENTFRDFCLALRQYPDALVVLLVDAEAPVRSANPWYHLTHDSGDGWRNPGAEDRQCHLMVQTMEAWLIADRDKLAAYYGKEFQVSALPSNTNVEEVSKENLRKALKRATRGTRKGEYHKTKHGPAILAEVRPEEVARRAPHCQRLFDVLAAAIEEL